MLRSETLNHTRDAIDIAKKIALAQMKRTKQAFEAADHAAESKAPSAFSHPLAGDGFAENMDAVAAAASRKGKALLESGREPLAPPPPPPLAGTRSGIGDAAAVAVAHDDVDVAVFSFFFASLRLAARVVGLLGYRPDGGLGISGVSRKTIRVPLIELFSEAVRAFERSATDVQIARATAPKLGIHTTASILAATASEAMSSVAALYAAHLRDSAEKWAGFADRRKRSRSAAAATDPAAIPIVEPAPQLDVACDLAALAVYGKFSRLVEDPESLVTPEVLSLFVQLCVDQALDRDDAKFSSDSAVSSIAWDEARFWLGRGRPSFDGGEPASVSRTTRFRQLFTAIKSTYLDAAPFSQLETLSQLRQQICKLHSAVVPCHCTGSCRGAGGTATGAAGASECGDGKTSCGARPASPDPHQSRSMLAGTKSMREWYGGAPPSAEREIAGADDADDRHLRRVLDSSEFSARVELQRRFDEAVSDSAFFVMTQNMHGRPELSANFVKFAREYSRPAAEVLHAWLASAVPKGTSVDDCTVGDAAVAILGNLVPTAAVSFAARMLTLLQIPLFGFMAAGYVPGGIPAALAIFGLNFLVGKDSIDAFGSVSGTVRAASSGISSLFLDALFDAILVDYKSEKLTLAGVERIVVAAAETYLPKLFDASDSTKFHDSQAYRASLFPLLLARCQRLPDVICFQELAHEDAAALIDEMLGRDKFPRILAAVCGGSNPRGGSGFEKTYYQRISAESVSGRARGGLPSVAPGGQAIYRRADTTSYVEDGARETAAGKMSYDLIMDKKIHWARVSKRINGDSEVATIAVINVHPTSYTRLLREDKRVPWLDEYDLVSMSHEHLFRDVGRLVEWLDRRNPGEAVLVCGDMNVNRYAATPDSFREQHPALSHACFSGEYEGMLESMRCEQPPIVVDVDESHWIKTPFEPNGGPASGGAYTWDGRNNSVTVDPSWPKSYTWIDYVLSAKTRAAPIYADNRAVRLAVADWAHAFPQLKEVAKNPESDAKAFVEYAKNAMRGIGTLRSLREYEETNGAAVAPMPDASSAAAAAAATTATTSNTAIRPTWALQEVPYDYEKMMADAQSNLERTAAYRFSKTALENVASAAWTLPYLSDAVRRAAEYAKSAAVGSARWLWTYLTYARPEEKVERERLALSAVPELSVDFGSKRYFYKSARQARDVAESTGAESAAAAATEYEPAKNACHMYREVSDHYAVLSLVVPRTAGNLAKFCLPASECSTRVLRDPEDLLKTRLEKTDAVGMAELAALFSRIQPNTPWGSMWPLAATKWSAGRTPLSAIAHGAHVASPWIAMGYSSVSSIYARAVDIDRSIELYDELATAVINARAASARRRRAIEKGSDPGAGDEEEKEDLGRMYEELRVQVRSNWQRVSPHKFARALEGYAARVSKAASEANSTDYALK
jgi:hypothetical protein